MKKSLIGILMTTVMLVSIILPIISIPAVSAADSADWYKTVSGNLSTDAYSLYPYLPSDLKIGFSKFGEMIDSSTNVGLEYSFFGSGVDPFAPPYGADIGSIVKSDWLNGWLCNITYYHTIRSEVRNVWVSAQHGDPLGVTYGGDWIRVDFPNDHILTDVEDPRDPGYFIGNYAAGSENYGGRKTNGTTVTEPIQVLYNGPRSFVALLKTTVYDHFLFQSDSTAEDIPLLQVRFMIVFDKVNKQVVVFKELKTLVTDKYTDVMKVQFSNRGEVDLGNEASGYASYFHFYTQGTTSFAGSLYNDTAVEGQSTVYDRNWVMDQTETPSPTSQWKNYSASGPYPQTSSATYDLAVAVNPTVGYTWWAAFWPSLSDWSIDAWPMWWHSMMAYDPHTIDSRVNETQPRPEPTIPFYIGEWDTELKPKGKTTQQMYRFVTVYGVTSRNDATDANQPPGTDFFGNPVYYSNVIDSETKYLLNEVFNPWDLYSAVEKNTRSWVEWTTAANWVGNTMTFKTTRKPVIVVPNSLWNQYGVNSERVIDVNASGAGITPMLYRRYSTYGEYSIASNADGTATITVTDSGAFFHGNVSGHIFKILYSTLPDVSGSQSYTTTWGPAVWYNITALTWFEGSAGGTWKDGIDAVHSVSVTVPTFTVYATNKTTSGSGTNWTDTWTVTKAYNETDFKVFLGETYVATLPNLYDPINVTLNDMTFMFDLGAITKSLAATTNMTVIWPNDKSETTHVDYLNHTITFAISITQENDTDGNGFVQNVTWTQASSLTVKADYRDYLMGRFEWAVVGRDAASVDSAGTALITAAFKNKQVEIGMAGADMYDTEVANQMPWVMAKMTAGDEWVNYEKTGAGTDPGNYRAYLRDDWCRAGTTANDEWPIASSNMIGVGGPLANLLAYYANDFTSAIFGLSNFTDYTAWKNKIVPVTCWNHTKGYVDSNTVGYAVVSTYLDLNGTVVFLVWGNWGRDTFYASRWFHEHMVYQLQSAPRGLTSEVIQINYQTTVEGYKPTGFSVVECLGTISERQWISGITKGGIHDP
jgi:hypothetical protein